MSLVTFGNGILVLDLKILRIKLKYNECYLTSNFDEGYKFHLHDENSDIKSLEIVLNPDKKTL